MNDRRAARGPVAHPAAAPPARVAAAAPTLALALLLAACAGDSGGRSDPALPAGAPLSVEPVPAVSVGVLEGDPMQELDEVRSAFLSPTGELVIAMAHEIRVFDAEGGFLRSLGGQGEGPGEFMDLRNAWGRGDTIEAWDGRARRLTRFHPDGTPEAISLAGLTEPLDQALGPLGDGWAFTRIGFENGRDRMGATVVGRDGGHRVNLADLDGMTRHQVPGLTGPHPITPTAVYRVDGGGVYAGETVTPVIRVWQPPDTGARAIPLPLEPSATPGEAFAEVLDASAARSEEPEAVAATRARLAAFPTPDAISLFWTFLVDPEGFVWVRPYEPTVHALPLGGRPDGRAGPGGEWVVVGLDGGEVARIVVPPDLEPRQITQDAVVGVARDELGVETVRVHRLVRN